MSREHKYRGLTKEGKEVKGSLIQSKDCQKAYIGYAEYSNDGVSVIYYEEVLPATVGEFTGKRDKNGKEIHEGGKVKDEVAEIGPDTVVWNEQELSWWLLETNISLGSMIFSKVQHYDPMTGQPYWTDIEIIGSIHSPAEGEQI